MQDKNPKNLPVYILHGWSIDPDNRQKWQPVVEGLQSADLKAEFVAMPGFGEVEACEPWELHDYVGWLLEKIKRAGHREVILVGHSFGGQLAVRFSAQFPEMVHTLILIDASGIRPFTLKAKVKRAVFQSIAKVGKVIFPAEKARFWLHKLARERDYLQAPPVMRETMKNVLADEVVDDLKNVRAQTLILWGEHDTATPVTHAQLFHEGILGSQLEFIADARHSPQYTHSGEVVKKIVEFLQVTET